MYGKNKRFLSVNSPGTW